MKIAVALILLVALATSRAATTLPPYGVDRVLDRLSEEVGNFRDMVDQMTDLVFSEEGFSVRNLLRLMERMKTEGLTIAELEDNIESELPVPRVRRSSRSDCKWRTKCSYNSDREWKCEVKYSCTF